MDPQIAARFNDRILAAACLQYATPMSALRPLDGFESFIYEAERSDGPFILRIGHSTRRSSNLIHGEVDWIDHLAAGGTPVARALPSSRGNLVEALADDEGGEFLCTAFAKAPGAHATRSQLTEPLFLNYGRLLGRMHALAKTYTPSNLAWQRYTWDSPENNIPDRQLQPADEHIRRKYEALREHLRSLPRDTASYGMIHQDAHLSNLFVDTDLTLTLFDFDDCVYGHFIYDLAMVLFYMVLWGHPDPSAFTGQFMPVFLRGYREHHQLDQHWLQELPHFLKLREIDLFAAILYTQGETPTEPWSARYMAGRRTLIENDMPFLEYDWSSLARHL